MNTNSDFLKNIKVGDKVFLEIDSRFAAKNISICEVKKITPTRKDIVLNNGYKFDKDGGFKNNDWYCSVRLLEYTEENMKLYKEFHLKEKLMYTLRNDFDKVKKMSLEECKTIFDIFQKYDK